MVANESLVSWNVLTDAGSSVPELRQRCLARQNRRRVEMVVGASNRRCFLSPPRQVPQHGLTAAAVRLIHACALYHRVVHSLTRLGIL